MEYIGDLKDGVPHGVGTKRWPNGNWYHGDYVEGKTEGTGAHYWNNPSTKMEGIAAGDLYHGGFKAGAIEGKGLRYTKDGKTFEEEWVGNQIVSSVAIPTTDAHTAEYTRLIGLVQRGFGEDTGMSGRDHRQLQAMMGAAKWQSSKVVMGNSAETITLDKDSLEPSATLVFKDCTDCTIAVTTRCTKIMVQDCNGCSFAFRGDVLTSTVELYMCDNTTCAIETPVKTFQADMCNSLAVTFESHEHMQNVVWAGCEGIRLALTASPHGPLSLESGFEQVAAEYKNISAEAKEREQFIVRVIGGKLLQERVVRLANGFPTTERERREFDRVQEANAQKLAEESGLTIRRKVEPNLVGRNDPCACGSGKKSKKCCGS